MDMVPRQSFSLLQSRKFLVPTSKDDDIDETRRNILRRAAKLCPSMDLILVKSTNPSSSSPSLVIYRSLSWQKVADITLPESLGDGTAVEGVGGSNSSDARKQSLSYCWSPNGQCIAVALESSVSLYGVESLVTASGAGGAGGTVSGSSNATWTIALEQHKAASGNDESVDVLALHWVHVGKNHPTAASPSAAEEEREVSWRYQSHYIDQSTKFLPPSAYYSPDETGEAGGGAAGTTDDAESSSLAQGSLPECRTPLSVLCISTNDMKHRLYLHGRYPLLTLPKSNNGIIASTAASSTRASSTKPPLVVASNDLAYWLTTTPAVSGLMATATNNNFLTLYHTPFLKRDRYALQQIATLHTSITAHLQTIQRSVAIVADSWKTSLRPLDQKLRPLIALLRNYGVEVDPNSNNTDTTTTLSAVMKEYIMMGHVTHSSSVANAMDQFFTGIQLNDQLVQRMERSLLASMANVESTAIRSLLRPTQALGWQIQELGGLVQFFDIASCNDSEIDDESNADDIRNDKCQLLQELAEGSEKLWVSVENVMTSIVTGRMLVRDFCGWLRHAGSQVKARGTAPNSVQRENAKKRRISQAVLERLVTILNNSSQKDLSVGNDEKHQIGLSESLLDLQVTEMLKGPINNFSTVPSLAEPSYRPQSPSSVRGILYPTPNVCQSLQQTIDATKLLFSNPLSNVPEQMKYKDIFLPRVSEKEECKIATHSRIGRDSASCVFWDDDEDEEENRTYFLPKIDPDSNHYANLSPMSGLENCRQWFLIAQAHGATIQLFCLPLGWKQTEDDDDFDRGDLDDENHDENDIPFYLTSKLTLPEGGQVLQIGFYGDDGKSSLSSGIDSGTGREGRQKLGFIYQKSFPSLAKELWTTSYDSISWQAIPFDPMLLNASQVDTNCSQKVLQVSVGESRDDGEDVLFAQSRTISEESSVDFCELFLCGSRGVGGVATMSDELIRVDIIDLEDEEDDEEEEESYIDE
eukprot:jgi/Psemu1/257216/estExt_Genewise1Plus.C_2130041